MHFISLYFQLTAIYKFASFVWINACMFAIWCIDGVIAKITANQNIVDKMQNANQWEN